jgi:23S rRNA (cytidine1920-2'-O)/16S rRNA (cytidine1409-2'-O)-methyltransferase
MSNRLRLDELLVTRGFYPSRSRARDAVLRGTVNVSGEMIDKPSRLVDRNAELALSDEANAYVSRAALKLIHGLDHFAVAVEGRRCLDIGASTGGFTQVLLERGAAHVTAIDVGHGQLAAEIAKDARVTSIEGLNARELQPGHLGGPIDLIVCDVSFISLKLALPPALSLAKSGSDLVALIKPQFEVGREAIGKGGIVKASDEHARACREIEEFLVSGGWRVAGVIPSPVLGGDGNREFLVAARKLP